MEIIKRVILEFLRVLIFIIWSIIGAIFWVPFLARMVAIFTVSVLLSVTRGTALGSAEAGLNAGVNFYIEGFTRINEGINNIINDNPRSESTVNIDSESIQSIFIQLAYTLVFWCVTLLMIGVIPWGSVNYNSAPKESKEMTIEKLEREKSDSPKKEEGKVPNDSYKNGAADNTPS